MSSSETDPFSNEDTVMLPSARDVISELAASLERCADEITAHFAASAPPGPQLAGRLALLDVSGVALDAFVADPELFVVVGRHSEAVLRSRESPSLSLRHVLLIPRRSDLADHVLLDVIALAPTTRVAPWPLPLPPDLADVCTALVLGDALLLVAPVPTGVALIATQPAAEVTTKLAPLQPTRVREDRLPASGYTEPQEHSHTRISSATPLLMLPSLADDVPGDARLVLEVRDADTRVRIGLREPWLEGGLVLGRDAGKCSHAALGRALRSESVSRCHVFLRREGDDVVFYDTASTCGIALAPDEDADLIRRFAIHAPPSTDEGVDQPPVNPKQVWLWLTPDVRVSLYRAEEGDSSPAADD